MALQPAVHVKDGMVDGAYASQAKNVSYDNTDSRLTATDVQGAVDEVNQNIQNTASELQQNFQAGVDTVYDAVVAKGSTPTSHSLSDVVTGINNIPTGITLVNINPNLLQSDAFVIYTNTSTYCSIPVYKYRYIRFVLATNTATTLSYTFYNATGSSISSNSLSLPYGSWTSNISIPTNAATMYLYPAKYVKIHYSLTV